MISLKWARLAPVLAVSLTQGLALFLLAHADINGAWPSTQPLWSTPLWTLAVAGPLLLHLSMEPGRFRRSLGATAAVAGLLMLLAMYTGWQMTPATGMLVNGGRFEAAGQGLVGAMVVSLGIALFKALMYMQPLVNRERASYGLLFQHSWRNLLVAGLAWVMALGVFALLMLWAQLFVILGMRFFRDLFLEPWFLLPLLAIAFGLGAHIFRGLARVIDTLTSLADGLMRLLLPLLTVLMVTFLAALPFTGLKPLWDVGSGTGLLMALNALALFFVNAVYQAGERRPYPLAVHRAVYSATALVPIVSALALYGLSLRIGQYGFSVERCWALLTGVMLSLFSCGYTLSIFRRRDAWQQGLQSVNRALGLVLLGGLLLANSPLMDFRKISLASQVARVDSGAIDLEQFDFFYAHRSLGRPAWLWLEAAAANIEDEDPQLAERIRNPAPPDVLLVAQAGAGAGPLSERLLLRPAPFEIPEALKELIDNQPFMAVGPGEHDNAPTVLIETDLNADGVNEYALLGSMLAEVAFQKVEGEWRPLRLSLQTGVLPSLLAQPDGAAPADGGRPGLVAFTGGAMQIPRIGEQLRSGAIETATPEFRELRVGELRYVVVD